MMRVTHTHTHTHTAQNTPAMPAEQAAARGSATPAHSRDFGARHGVAVSHANPNTLPLAPGLPSVMTGCQHAALAS
jgi:hypothetical protein